jgi:hypothetical protein
MIRLGSIWRMQILASWLCEVGQFLTKQPRFAC